MEPILLEELVVIDGVPCRVWMHPDDNSVFFTLRDRQFYSAAQLIGFLPYYEPPVPPVYFKPAVCPECGSVLKGVINPYDIDAYYAIVCRDCGRGLMAKTRYSEEKKQDIKSQREAIPHPGNRTVLMQILGKSPSDAEARINYFLNPGNKYGFPENAKTGGAAFLNESCKGVLRDPGDYYNLWFSCFTPEFRELHIDRKSVV